MDLKLPRALPARAFMGASRRGCDLRSHRRKPPGADHRKRSGRPFDRLHPVGARRNRRHPRGHSARITAKLPARPYWKGRKFFCPRKHAFRKPLLTKAARGSFLKVSPVRLQQTQKPAHPSEFSLSCKTPAPRASPVHPRCRTAHPPHKRMAFEPHA